MRRARRGVATAVALGAMVGGMFVATATAAATTYSPKISVTPHTNLADGEIVHVSGSGFPDSVTLGVAECAAGGPVAVSDCDISTAQLLKSSSTGTFAISYYVDRYITVGRKSIDCATKDSCNLAAATYPRVTTAHAGESLEFNPRRKPIIPIISVSPAKGLAPNQLVTVTGRGFSPKSFVNLSECTESATGCITLGNAAFGSTSAKGRITLQFRVSSEVVTYPRGRGSDRVVSCEGKSQCMLEVGGGSHVNTPAEAPISFDPDKAAIDPSIALSAQSGLADGEVLTVSGGGFTPHSTVSVLECQAGGYPIGCRTNDAATTVATGTGTASVQIAVEESGGSGKQAFDCASSKCSVFLAAGGDPWYAGSASISFNNSLPPVVPGIAVSPATGLVSGEVVTVDGSGFPAGATVLVAECSLGKSLDSCQNLFYWGTVDANAAGGFSEGLAVQAVLPNGKSCGTSGNRCRIVEVNYDDEPRVGRAADQVRRRRLTANRLAAEGLRRSSTLRLPTGRRRTPRPCPPSPRTGWRQAR